MKTQEFVLNLISTTKVPSDIRERCARQLAKNKKYKDATEAGKDKLITRKVKVEKKRTVTLLKFLRNVLLYLETNPREEFLTKQLDSLNKQLEAIPEKFQTWIKEVGVTQYKDKTETQLKAIFQKEMDLKKVKEQASFLNFILK